jgi:tetratricopeptide (TPR) repeat protein
VAEPWRLLVRQGSQALLEGRLQACERLAARAAALAPAEAAPGLLAVAGWREQGRAAEAELLARELVAAHPGIAEVHALLGAVLADLGRDADAGRQLDLVESDGCASTAGALAAEIAAALNLPGPAEALHDRLASGAGDFLPTTGAVARQLGLLCHVLGRWDEAESHFDAALRVNEAAGAPVLAAHARRQYSALLRVRGDEGDWERAIELLADAAAVYRRLEIDRLADESEAVLRRSQEMAADPLPAAAVNLFRPAGDGWELSYGGRSATVADSAGLRHLAALVASDGRPLHVVDLALGPGGDAARGGGNATAETLRDQMVAEYHDRLAALDRQLCLATVPGPPDSLAASLARAERDLLEGALAAAEPGVPAAGAVGDRARRLVALRIRIALDAMEEALPALARHLRRSIRTGTFCLYEPERPERWKMGP